jgi:hypothetical protein
MEMSHRTGLEQILDGLDREAVKDPELKLAADRAKRFLGRDI